MVHTAMAMALNVSLSVCWRRRRSDEMTELVYDLSKSDMTKAREHPDSGLGYISRTLLNF